MAEAALELALTPGATRALLRHPAIATRARGRAIALSFHGSADGALGEAGLAVVVETRGRGGAVQRLVRSMPAEDGPWRPGAPMPVLAETPLAGDYPDLAALAGAHGLGEGLQPQGLAAFSGRSLQLVTPAGVTLTLLAGSLRAVSAEREVARVTLEGEERAVFQLATSLATALPLAVPATSLAEEARGLAQGKAPRPLRLGAPSIPREATAAEALSIIVSHLTLAMLANAPAAHAGETPEGTHQTRVALRRLRSALSLFKHIAGAEGAAASAGLKALASCLGPARDWDVFIGGRLAEIRRAFPEDGRIAELEVAARARRDAAYVALRAALEAPGFRLLGLSLAALAAAPPAAEEPAARFAVRALNRRLKRVLRHGEDLSPLPVAELHRLRLDAKRLRYAGEMFAPLFGRKKVRRFLAALASVQEELGHLNDIVVAAGLLGQIATPGEDGAFAAGVAEGWIAAKADGAREAAFTAWERFLGREVFWDG
ncbi:MAG: CHAD domain-containing protein [Acetobacteraceae bacterium]|nr:CHAD domain-containing protein [Acetobacteraceae bacterium]